MQNIHSHYTHPDTLSKHDLVSLMLQSVTKKLTSALEVFGFTTYADAKAYVQQQTTAGSKVWDIIDERYANRESL